MLPSSVLLHSTQLKRLTYSRRGPAFALVLLVGIMIAGPQVFAGQLGAGVQIKWSKRPGVTRYRLQIARDERFTDVLFDGRVTGEQYLARELSPGIYYWRIASADYQTLEFQTPVRFEVTDPHRKPIIGFCTCDPQRRQTSRR